MSELVTFSIKVKPENLEELKRWFKNELHNTRTFEGCNDLSVHIDQDDPNHLFLLGKWASRESREKYIAWREERGDLEKFVAWLSEPPITNYLTITDM